MIIQGDALAVLRRRASESVQAVITSPPYYGLRDYQIPPSIWDAEPKCRHEWQMETVAGELRTGLGLAKFSKDYRGGGHKQATLGWIQGTRGFCRNCGAWRGPFGLEPTPDLYVKHAVSIFREVRRVLRNDGTLWLNMGDCYATGGSGGFRGDHQHDPKRNSATIPRGAMANPNRLPLPGLKAKDLIGMPWRVAFALQADGWYLRSDIIWHKPNPMPESVGDRPTKAHEYLFLLSKAKRYYYDAEAIKEPASENSHDRTRKDRSREAHKTMPTAERNGMRPIGCGPKSAAAGSGIKYNNSFSAAVVGLVPFRNKRTVWRIAAHPFKGAHFATFPPKLIEPCVLAGCPQGGIVLDPFSGAGTTGLVAKAHGRRYIGIELNPDYIEMQRERLAAAH